MRIDLRSLFINRSGVHMAVDQVIWTLFIFFLLNIAALINYIRKF